uniref:Tr-type G domain-containing protein n=1 Tax=Hemiselmis andersenii TaxID=464988 RepID=A0A7S0U8T8_HEMAN|mmetsp:Transcript_37614/g.87578  ORF Transcript_37614/g.87578 Transcript_37614/m.87578 type:complete len:599 (+) Transcript_37614:63-1859(+)
MVGLRPILALLSIAGLCVEGWQGNSLVATRLPLSAGKGRACQGRNVAAIRMQETETAPSPSKKPSAPTEQELSREIGRRRTFAIISHPDAGKTTMTEKLLLYGGAVQEAGAVKAKGERRRATSDWMKIEQDRGISISSTALQFEYRGMQLNLLDTPGHEDFSEDTYRTIAAADNAVMLLDGAKGLEAQTLKLFNVVQKRKLPLFTFINKMDRPALEPLELLDTIENVLKIKTSPVTWPIGSGDRFMGIYDRSSSSVQIFSKESGGAKKATEVEIDGLDDPKLADLVPDDLLSNLKEELEILDEIVDPLDMELVRAQKQTPVWFGSGYNNFGVETFLNRFIDLSLPPSPRTSGDTAVPPEDKEFTGFVFKLQANMDPKHRDRIAFVRVCSGRFDKDMQVLHTRTGKTVRLSAPSKLFAQRRETVDTAYAGDIVGFVNPGAFSIGDTLTTGKKIQYEGIPTFSPELFNWIRNPNPSKQKNFKKGIDQLREEGAVQVLWSTSDFDIDPVLAAVGALQFEVVASRLKTEYGVDSSYEALPYSVARWIDGGWDVADTMKGQTYNGQFFKDSQDRPVLLVKNQWALETIMEKFPDVNFLDVAPL